VIAFARKRRLYRYEPFAIQETAMLHKELPAVARCDTAAFGALSVIALRAAVPPALCQSLPGRFLFGVNGACLQACNVWH
jgi:hypothetical protein